MLEWIRRKVQKRRSLKKIDAMRQIPEILRQMSALRHGMIEAQYEELAKMPPEVAQGVLAAHARQMLTALFPVAAQQIEDKVPPEERNEAYVMVMVEVAKALAPIMEELTAMKLAEIEEECRTGIDRELDTLRVLKKGG